MIESHLMIWFEYKIFDLKTCDLIWIWFEFMWFDLWFHQITNFNKLGQQITIIWQVFYCSKLFQYFGNSTISNLCSDLQFWFRISETPVLLIRPHRSTMYTDVAYCYRPSSTVCHSVTLVSPAKTAEPIEMQFRLRTRVGPGNHVFDGSPE